MTTKARALLIALTTLLTVALGAPAAHAGVNDPLFISRDGDLKATASWQANGWMCANLVKGTIATVTVNGSYVNDYTANGVPECGSAIVTKGVVYNWRLVWQGTGGEILNAQGTVKRTQNP